MGAIDDILGLLAYRHNFIVRMEWETQVMDAAGLSQDQLRFAVAFASMVVVCPVIRLISSPTGRHLYALLSGLLLVYYPFGINVLHVAFPLSLTYLAMRFAPRHCGTLSWLATFPYLLAVHAADFAAGHDWHKGEMDFTGGLMVLVLKLVATAMSYQDSLTTPLEEMSPYQRAKHLTHVPSLLALLGYSFGSGNLLGGPFGEFKDYENFIEFRGNWDPKAKPIPSGLMPAAVALVESFVTCAIHMGTAKVANMNAVYTEWYLASNVFWRLMTMVAIGVTYRCKYYFAWKLAEAGYALSGQDFAGWSKEGKAQWGACANALPIKVEFCESARNLGMYWNVGTGVFLRHYVFVRLTPKGKKAGLRQLLATQLVCSVWHGLLPGYWLFFGSSAFFFHASKVLYRTEQALGLTPRNPLLIAFKMLVTSVQLNYLAIAFLLLKLRPCLDAWASVYYLPHLYMLGLTLLGFALPSPRRRAVKGHHAPASSLVPVDGITSPNLQENGQKED